MFYGGAFIAYLGVRHYFKAKLRRMPRNHSVREEVPKTRTGAMLREGAPADVTFLAVNGDDGAHFPICDESKVFLAHPVRLRAGRANHHVASAPWHSTKQPERSACSRLGRTW